MIKLIENDGWFHVSHRQFKHGAKAPRRAKAAYAPYPVLIRGIGKPGFVIVHAQQA
jgi:hypothetical protein